MDSPETGPTVEFRALGTPLLSRAEVECQSILTRPKLLGLLSFLACAPAGFHRRDTLLGLFWAELDQDRARRALRQSLYYLRQSLGSDVVIARGEDEVGLDERVLWCDVRAFEAALRQGREEEASELYRGDLLAGFFVSGAPEFERWLDERRQELRRKGSAAAWSLALTGEAAGNAAAAGHWARRAAGLEAFDERLLTQAVELLDRMGDRAGALRMYDAFRRRLASELEIEPSPETEALIARIRGRVEVPVADSDAGASMSPDGGLAATASDDASVRVVPRPAAPEPPVRGLRMPERRWVTLGLILCAAVGVLLYPVLGPGFGGPDPDPERVVVAVFDNQTGDSRLDPLGRMAADWITQALHESGVAEVVPSTIGLAPRPDFTDGQTPDAASLAEATGAGTVLTGAYYLRGDSVEIQAQIVDAGQGNLLSALPPAGAPLRAPGAAVDSLSRRAVRTLAVLFEPSLANSADLSRPPTLEAYRQYLEGLRFFQQVPMQMREALPYFHRALELDSGFLAPRFYVVMAHWNLAEFALADSNAQLLESKRTRISEPQRHMLDWMVALLKGDQMGALVAARARGGIDVGAQALAVNRPAEAIDVLTAVDISAFYFQWLTLMEAYHVSGDYRRELAEAGRGRDAYPGRLRMFDAELRALAALGRIDDVERRLDEVVTLLDEGRFSPGMVMANTVAELRVHGYPGAAADVAERALAWWRSRSEAETATWSDRFGLAFAYYLAERRPEAESVFRELAGENPDDVETSTFLGTLAARRDSTEALAISAGLESRVARPYLGGDAYRQARIAAQLGDREGAVSLLREALARGFPYTVWLHRDVDLAPLRGYPPFEEFMRPRG